MLSEEEAAERLEREAEAAAMTEEFVANTIKELGKTPSVSKVRDILNLISAVKDGEHRANLFITAKQNLKSELKKLVDEAQKRAGDDWRSSNSAGAKSKGAATSKVPLPAWGNAFEEHKGRTFVVGLSRDTSEHPVPLHSPLRIMSAIIYPDRTIQNRDHKYGVVLEFEDAKSNVRTLVFERAQALSPKTNKEGMIQDLANAGVAFAKDGVERLQEMVLSSGGLEDGGAIYDYPGCREPNCFITPGGEVIGSANRGIGLAKPLAGIKRVGTLDGWRTAIAAAFCEEVVSKAPHVPATVLFTFVSALADLAKEEMSFILCLAGKTTRLKTFALRLKASGWGVASANDEPGVLMTFNQTPNKMEENAVERSGCGLAIDDSTLIEAQKLGPFLYRITTGAEKGRKYEDRRSWSLACTITSEVPIQQFLRGGGYEPPPGLMSRVVEITIADNRVSDEPVNAMRGAFQNYGHAGPAFVEEMLAKGWDREKIEIAIASRLTSLLGGTGDQEQSRRAARGVAFIGLAGEIAKEAGLIPAKFDVDAFSLGLWERVKYGADTSGDVVGIIKNQLATDIREGTIPIYSKKGVSLSTGTGSGAICVLEFGKLQMPVFVLPGLALAKIVGSRVTVADAAKALDDAGILWREQDDRLTWKKGRTGVGDVPSYVLYARGVWGDGAEYALQEHYDARRGEDGPKLKVVAGTKAEAGS